MTRTEAIKLVKSRGYIKRKDGPEVTCPICKQPVQCYTVIGTSVLKQMDAGMRFHLDGYCEGPQ